MPSGESSNAFEGFIMSLKNTLEGPVVWFKESVVEPNQKKYPWYHEKFRRVPSIDTCYTDDFVCIFEANDQFKRDKFVDSEIVNILRKRFEDCVLYEAPDHLTRCKPLLDTYEKASENWFIKYGDLGGYANAKSCYLKQKHRMLWERRHGPVGTGMKDQRGESPADE